MRFSSIVATFALAASASAWKIPQGTQDGVYKVETLADGSIVHTKIIDASEIDRNQPLVPGKSLVPDALKALSWSSVVRLRLQHGLRRLRCRRGRLEDPAGK